MYDSLTRRLATLPDSTVLYPGHRYSQAPSATMGETRAHNYVLRIPTIEQWRSLMG
jgi:glyoxylase-like metal-dependent hydrolase (beta-lactamase superfamily II)